MATSAVFKFYNNGKLLLGSWVRNNGGVYPNYLFPHIMERLTPHNIPTKKDLYDIISHYFSDERFKTFSSGNKKDPYNNLTYDSWEVQKDLSFWDTGNRKDEEVYCDFIYEIRFTKKGIKIVVKYGINTISYFVKMNYSHQQASKDIITDVVKWVDDIDYGMNDCNCGENNLVEQN